MNIQDYIASGVLELYVLGELSPEEQAAVEAMAVRHPEVRQEIDHIAQTLQAVAMQGAIAPRPALKENILNSVAARNSGSVPTAAGTANKTLSLLRYGLAAALTLALLSAAAALYFRSQWKQTEERLSSLLVQNQLMAEQYQTASQEAAALTQTLSIVTHPDFRRVAMAGLDPAPNSLAHVYWNQNSEQVYLQVDRLPDNAAGKQYQLWAIVEGKPVSAGVFDVRGNSSPGLIPMQAVPDASAFAVTLEPQGGSESPTLEAMYLQGAV